MIDLEEFIYIQIELLEVMILKYLLELQKVFIDGIILMFFYVDYNCSQSLTALKERR